ncbi:SCO family protein [Neolewinella aurantiaca]|uniref:SCO family protein n=1 Tax=Neolewinella aurantiaca TaxID=2602767 RepID=A0A5C7FY66_9BACT|nr:SCO family protein [Neolewinella aurantiaca]TXF90551.1 SCO family protein [Neolewinella aurantiaca]
MYSRALFFILSVFILVGCGDSNGLASIESSDQHPFYARHPKDPKTGKYLENELGFPGNHPTDPATGAPAPEPVRDWNYIDQLERPFGSDSLRGKVYVAEFFFTSCPTICPKVKGQMLRLEEEFADEPDFRMVSFTVDPKRDTPEKMKMYAEQLGTKNMDRWRYIYGDRFEISELDADYLSIAEENPDAPGGFDHSGYIVLVDRNGFVRSYASGLKPEEVDFLMKDIRLLLDAK